MEDSLTSFPTFISFSPALPTDLYHCKDFATNDCRKAEMGEYIYYKLYNSEQVASPFLI